MAIIDCKKYCEEVKLKLLKDIEKKSYVPQLIVIQVGDDPASNVYIRNKKKACEDVGIICKHIKLDANMSTEDIEYTRCVYNDWLKGIGRCGCAMVQLPVPEKYDWLIDCINPMYDPDVMTKENLGKFYRNDPGALPPCTPDGIMRLLRWSGVNVDGMNCVVIGRSNIVGRPMAAVLEHNNATVTLCHSHTSNLIDITRNADLLVSAVGKAGFVTADMVKDGAIVIDVGINRDSNGKLVGDVLFNEVEPKASLITTVPGGIGPVTVTTLLEHIVEVS